MANNLYKMHTNGLFAVLLGLVSISVCNFARSQEDVDGEEIFPVVTQVLLAREQPRAWGVWNSFIESAAMTSVRVPGHKPENQFVRNIPEVDWALQSLLLSPSIEQKSKQRFKEYNIHSNDKKFVGFLNRSQLQDIAGGNNSGFLLIGFSRIAFGDKGKNALLYSEICTADTEPVCGGDEFLLERNKKSWTIKKHAQLWMGGINPFWSYY